MLNSLCAEAAEQCTNLPFLTDIFIFTPDAEQLDSWVNNNNDYTLISQTLQFYCNVRFLSWYVVCRLSSVTQLYCDMTTEITITQFSHEIA